MRQSSFGQADEKKALDGWMVCIRFENSPAHAGSNPWLVGQVRGHIVQEISEFFVDLRGDAIVWALTVRHADRCSWELTVFIVDEEPTAANFH